MANNEAMREAFEEWHKEKYCYLDRCYALDSDGDYINCDISFSLEAWQSAIAHAEASHADEVKRLKEEIAELEGMVALQADDVKRYQRLRIIGAAPYKTKHLAAGTVLRFQNLDNYCDDELKNYPSRGEAISASAETVQAFRDKLTEPLQSRIKELEGQVESLTYSLSMELKSNSDWGSRLDGYVSDLDFAYAARGRYDVIILHPKGWDKMLERTKTILAAEWEENKLKPLRREVAMLNKTLSDFYLHITVGVPPRYNEIESSITDTQATAQAYEQKMKREGAIEALEDAQIKCPYGGMDGVACETCATSKKAG